MKKNGYLSVLFALVILGIVVFLFFNYGSFLKTKSGDIQYVKISGQKIKVELANSPQSQEKGLSGKEKLKDNEGMLFVFDYPEKYSFWMKDMKFDLDIIWIGEDMKVVYIKRNAPADDIFDTYTPDDNSQDAKYVLEVLSGFSDRHNLEVGDKVDFVY